MSNDKKDEKKVEDEGPVVNFGAEMERAYLDFATLIFRYRNPYDITSIDMVIRAYDHIVSTFFRPEENLPNIHVEFNKLAELKAYTDQKYYFDNIEQDYMKKQKGLDELDSETYGQAAEICKKALAARLRARGKLDQYQEPSKAPTFRG